MPDRQRSTHGGNFFKRHGSAIHRAVKQAEKVIVVDPRRVGLAERADQWLQLRPGSGYTLALAMIHTIIAEDLFDHEFVHHYTIGFDRLPERVQPFTPQWAEPITRVAAGLGRKRSSALAPVRGGPYLK